MLAPTIIISSSSLGLITGLELNHDYKNKMHLTKCKQFTNIISCVTIGAVTGITFPVSFPLITTYAIYQNDIK